MTELEFLTTCSRPKGCFRVLARRSTLARVRLCGAAFGRMIPDLPPIQKAALGVLANHARGLASEADYATAQGWVWAAQTAAQADPAHRSAITMATIVVASAFNPSLVAGVRCALNFLLQQPGQPKLRGITRRRACEAMRCVAGNPFRPWTRLPPFLGNGWLQPDGTAIVVGAEARELADVIDRHGYYERLPILADALEESGLTDAGLLAHCREAGEHWPGCHAVELALGRGS